LKWLELSVDAPAEFVEPLSHIFHRYGHGGVAMEEPGGFNPDEGETPPSPDLVRITTYLPMDSTTASRRGGIDVGVALVSHVCPISPLQERVVEEEDWERAWKRHFHVLHVGERMVVVPTWREYIASESDIVIGLDPGMAFGTGHHPTTRMCMVLLEEFCAAGMRVLDVGCGSGILSIVAARLGVASVIGVEIDDVAARSAATNIADNGVDGVVIVYQGTLTEGLVPPEGFDLIVANVSAKVVSELAADMVSALRPGGRIIASGILDERQADVRQAIEAVGATIERGVVDGDWVALVATKGA
jgi:ribosomal protein L11 methyltransferase